MRNIKKIEESILNALVINDDYLGDTQPNLNFKQHVHVSEASYSTP